MGVFEKTKYFIIDMDGTFYLGDTMIDGADEFIYKIKDTGRDFCFFTNNSSNSVELCCKRLQKIGFPVTNDKVVLSSDVAVDFIKRNYNGKSVYLLGNKNLYDCFKRGGIHLCDEDPDIVVLGFDTDLTYERIHKACNYIANGAVYIATHPDMNCPTKDGFMPDTGAMIEMFAASTGKRPVIVGKPMLHTVNYIAGLLGCNKDELAFVGDRLETDIKIGFDNGIPTALVFSGVTDEKMLSESIVKPTVTAKNLKELIQYL